MQRDFFTRMGHRSINSIRLNRLYRGSAGLIGKPLAERSSLVVTALMESASDDLQRSALFLSDHTDALYDLVQFARLEELVDDVLSSEAAQNRVPERKLRRSRD